MAARGPGREGPRAPLAARQASRRPWRPRLTSGYSTGRPRLQGAAGPRGGRDLRLTNRLGRGRPARARPGHRPRGNQAGAGRDGGLGGTTDGGGCDYITTKAPDKRAIDSMLDRVFGKAVTKTGSTVSPTSSTLSAAKTSAPTATTAARSATMWRRPARGRNTRRDSTRPRTPRPPHEAVMTVKGRTQ